MIIASAKDPAAQNILKQLLELYPFEKSPDLPGAYVHLDALAMRIEGEATQMVSPPVSADEIIVASRHVSESGKPTLTVHASGELDKKKLAIAAPATMKSALEALLEARTELGLAHDVSLEATHHGPTGLGVPVTFIEIGSSSEQWRDEHAGEAVARAIIAATTPAKCRRAIGIGGPHYAPRHTEVALRTGIGIGHILPRYAGLDEELIGLAVARTSGGAELLAADWKGLGADQKLLLKRAAKISGIPLVRESVAKL